MFREAAHSRAPDNAHRQKKQRRRPPSSPSSKCPPPSVLSVSLPLCLSSRYHNSTTRRRTLDRPRSQQFLSELGFGESPLSLPLPPSLPFSRATSCHPSFAPGPPAPPEPAPEGEDGGHDRRALAGRRGHRRRRRAALGGHDVSKNGLFVGPNGASFARCVHPSPRTAAARPACRRGRTARGAPRTRTPPRARRRGAPSTHLFRLALRPQRPAPVGWDRRWRRVPRRARLQRPAAGPPAAAASPQRHTLGALASM